MLIKQESHDALLMFKTILLGSNIVCLMLNKEKKLLKNM